MEEIINRLKNILNNSDMDEYDRLRKNIELERLIDNNGGINERVKNY